ncbi:MAG: hypothetical protein EBX50_17950 [Chitinophagia bacterium]|nr:hypothetical protein [Chitinophagia bacterium]
MTTDSKLMFENFVNSLKAKAEVVEEKKRSRSTNPNDDIDRDGKKGTASDKYLANLNRKVSQAMAMKKKSEEEEAKARSNRISAASSKLLGDLAKTYSTAECEEILRKALDTHTASVSPHSENELTPAAPLPSAGPAVGV